MTHLHKFKHSCLVTSIIQIKNIWAHTNKSDFNGFLETQYKPDNDLLNILGKPTTTLRNTQKQKSLCTRPGRPQSEINMKKIDQKIHRIHNKTVYNGQKYIKKWSCEHSSLSNLIIKENNKAIEHATTNDTLIISMNSCISHNLTFPNFFQKELQLLKTDCSSYV